jgi:hypothetical protein
MPTRVRSYKIGICKVLNCGEQPLIARGLCKRHYQRLNPYSPSIDRKIAGGDYSPANCRMILIALNIGINHWGEEVYRLIAKSYLRQRREKKRQRNTPQELTQNYDLALEGQSAQSVRIRRH